MPRPAPGVLVADLDSEIVLYEPNREVCHILNASAAVIWRLVARGLPIDDLVGALETSTDVDRAVLRPQVLTTLAQLEELGALAPLDARAASTPGTSEVRAAVRSSALTSPDGVEPPDPPPTGPYPVEIGPLRASTAAILVRTDVPSVASTLERTLQFLPPAPVEVDHVEVTIHDAGPEQYRRFRIFVDGRHRWWSSEEETLAGEAIAQINEIVIADETDHVRFHAGAVERGGAVVLVAGASGRGKSTLTAALVRSGFQYLTDEVVAVARHGRFVVPYPKTLDLTPESIALLDLPPDFLEIRGRDKCSYPPDRIGTVGLGGELALVVLLDEDRDDQPPSSTAVAADSAADTLVDLVSNAFHAGFDAQSAMDAVVDIVRSVPVIRMGRVAPDVSVRIIDDALRRGAR